MIAAFPMEGRLFCVHMISLSLLGHPGNSIQLYILPLIVGLDPLSGIENGLLTWDF